MTERARHTRRLAALGLVPLSAGAFGGAMVWAGSHNPLVATVPTSSPTPVAASTTDPQVTAALAEVADAKAQIVALQAILDQRAAAAAAAGSAVGAVPAPATAGSAAGTAPAATSPKAVAKAPAAAAPAAPAPAAPARAAAPAAAPPVQTTTKASK